MTDLTKSDLAQVKSRLLPLSMLMLILEWLIECLPRRLIKIDLKATEDITVISTSRGEYHAMVNAPVFDIAITPAALQGGWYYFEAALVRNNGNREACISVDRRSLGKKNVTIVISANLRGTVREVFYLPPDVKQLRWSPTAAPGRFSQSQLLLHKITLLESTVRRVSRVLFDFWRFRYSNSATAVICGWWRAIIDLQGAYQQTATLRLTRLLDNDYPTFIALNDTLKANDIRAMRKQVQQLQFRPIISLIMYVDSPIVVLFRATLDSISKQIYPHWELVLAGHFAALNQCCAVVDEYRNINAQIKIIQANADEPQALLLNRAIAMAEGEYVIKIKQHDLITPHAIFMFALETNKHPDVDLVYSDNDYIDDDGKRSDPRFKPDWNEDLFFSCNYISDLILYRQARLMKLGGYRAGFDGAEDYDLSLRYIRDISVGKIRHIAKVLCHSRSSDQRLLPTTTFIPKKGLNNSTVCRPHISALQDFFAGSGITAGDGLVPGTSRIKHPLPEFSPLVSIIIPTRDQAEILRKCITSIQQNTAYANWEILVVDNQSIEPDAHEYFAQLQTDSRIKIIHYPKKFNYSALNNFAVLHARGEILALLNNDVEVITDGWLTEMVSHAIRPGIGAVGAKLLYSNGTVQHAGVILGLGGVAGHAHRYLKRDDHGYCQRAVVTQNLSAVTGACLVVRKSSYQQVNGLNEVDLPVAFNDIDFCLKLIVAGYRNVFTPYAQLYHHESLSRGPDNTPDKHARYLREYNYMKSTWGRMLQNDIAYNRNLTLESETFGLGCQRKTYT